MPKKMKDNPSTPKVLPKQWLGKGLHRKAIRLASQQGLSVNQLMDNALTLIASTEPIVTKGTPPSHGEPYASVPQDSENANAPEVQNPHYQDVPAKWGQVYLGPGMPVTPIFEPSHRDRLAETEPRSFQYVPQVNATIVPRIAYGLMSFAQLRSMAEQTPEVMMCVRLLTEAMKNFNPIIYGPDGSETQETDLNWMTSYPDRNKPWPVWLSRFLYNTLIYDAATLYRIRDGDNKTFGLRNIDGSTMFCLIDERGEQPIPPAPAFLQIILGIPKSMLSTEQIVYQPRMLRSESPYGRSPVEDAAIAVQTLYNIWAYEAAYYTDGNMPDSLMIAPQGWGVQQVASFEQSFNAVLAGNSALRRRVKFLPYGFTKGMERNVVFNSALYTAAVDRVGLMFGVPPAEIGAKVGGGAGGGGGSSGKAGVRLAENQAMRMGIAPLKTYVEQIFNMILAENGYNQFHFTLTSTSESPDPEIENKASLEQFQAGILTLNQTLSRLGYNEIPNGDVRIVRLGNTIVFLDQDLKIHQGDGIVPPNQQKPDQADPDKPPVSDGGGGDKHQETNVQTLQRPAPSDGEKMVKYLEYLDQAKHGMTLPAYRWSDLPAVLQNELTGANKLGVIYSADVNKMGRELQSLRIDGVPGHDESFYKHCGVCAEDESFYGAALSREVPVDFPVSGANKIEIVAMKLDGFPPRAALWKPEGGEVESLQEFIGGPQFMREEAAYLLDRAMKFRMVPVAYTAYLDGEFGAALAYSNGNQPAEDANTYSDVWIQRAAVLDYVMGNTDRHRGNWLTFFDDPERPILIDNGLSFPTDPSHNPASPFLEAMREVPLNPDTLDALAWLRTAPIWDEIRNLVGSTAMKLAQDRAIEVAERGSLPPLPPGDVATGHTQTVMETNTGKDNVNDPNVPHISEA